MSGGGDDEGGVGGWAGWRRWWRERRGQPGRGGVVRAARGVSGGMESGARGGVALGLSIGVSGGVGPGRSVASGRWGVGAPGRGGRGAARRRARDVRVVGRRCACGRSRGVASAADLTSDGGYVRAWLGSGEEEEEGPGRSQRLYKGKDL